MSDFKQTLTNWFNLKSGKVTHVALGLLAYLGAREAMGLGLSMVLPGGAFMVAGLAGAFIGFGNYYMLQSRKVVASKPQNMARNAALTAATAFGAAAAGGIFSAGAIAMPVVFALAAAGGVLQYMANPKHAGGFKLPSFKKTKPKKQAKLRIPSSWDKL